MDGSVAVHSLRPGPPNNSAQLNGFRGPVGTATISFFPAVRRIWAGAGQRASAGPDRPDREDAMRKNMLLTAAAGLAALVVQSGQDGAAAQTRTTLDIYVVDVEGGNATLFVAPSGESVLIDTGNVAPEAAIRDAERILAAARDARLTQIDTLITTHWHGDHFGGMAELDKRIPIRHFVDHGPNIQPQPAFDEFFAKTYPALYGKAKHTVAKPGDVVPVAWLDWRIVAAAGAVTKTPLAGAGAANRACASFTAQPVDPTENAQSVGSVVTFGKF